MPQGSAKHSAPIRGEIKGFSRSSRRRLLELFARLDVKGTRAKFITLTFAGMPSPMEAKKALRRWIMRLERKYPQWSAIWRFERQERGSPHFHILAFNLPYIPQKDLQKTWAACTREPLSIVDIRAMRNKKHAMQYVSKYIGKVEETSEDKQGNTSLEYPSYLHADDKQGRVWGYVNKDQLPFAVVETFIMQDDELAHYIRWTAAAQTRGKAGRTEYRTLLYSTEAYEILEWARERARMEAEYGKEAQFAAHNARMVAEQSFRRYTAREAWLTGDDMKTYSGVSIDIEMLTVKPFTDRRGAGLARVTLMTTQ